MLSALLAISRPRLCVTERKSLRARRVHCVRNALNDDGLKPSATGILTGTLLRPMCAARPGRHLGMAPVCPDSRSTDAGLSSLAQDPAPLPVPLVKTSANVACFFSEIKQKLRKIFASVSTTYRFYPECVILRPLFGGRIGSPTASREPEIYAAMR